MATLNENRRLMMENIKRLQGKSKKPLNEAKTFNNPNYEAVYNYVDKKYKGVSLNASTFDKIKDALVREKRAKSIIFDKIRNARNFNKNLAQSAAKGSIWGMKFYFDGDKLYAVTDTNWLGVPFPYLNGKVNPDEKTLFADFSNLFTENIYSVWAQGETVGDVAGSGGDNSLYGYYKAFTYGDAIQQAKDDPNYRSQGGYIRAYIVSKSEAKKTLNGYKNQIERLKLLSSQLSKLT